MTSAQLTQLLHARAEEFCHRFLSAGHKEGHEWLVGDSQNSPGRSLGVQLDGERRGLWNDRAADQGGTLLDILKIQNGDDYPKAADEARRFLGIAAFKPHTNGSGYQNPAFDPLKFAYAPKGEQARFANAAWAYHSASGEIIGYVCRFNLPTPPDSAKPKKEVRPLRLVDGQWKWKGWAKPEPKPIYNLHLLARRPDAPVLVVQGEKKCDAASRLFPEYVCITHQGGDKSVDSPDWSPLQNREIVIWPDNDDSGRVAALYLKARFPKSRIVKLPAGLPDAWDLADPVPPDISLRGLLDGAAIQPPAPDPEPFRLLGFDDSHYHYGSHTSGLITTLSADGHTELNLQRLAPDDWWAGHYFSKNGTDYKLAAKSLIARQHSAGFFDPDCIRGYGTWVDAGRVVYHAGDRLYIDSIETPLHLYTGRFLYPRRPRGLAVDLRNPATLADCAQFIRLCQRLRWSKPEHAWHFAGWNVAALVCGALDWRPHGWVVGSKGSGKTWIYHEIMVPMLGHVLKCQGVSSEAGIRQVLGRDAIPVIFDEIESKDESSMGRITKILELMRQASSESGGSIFKGTTTGIAKQYRIRSCFCLCSIAGSVKEPADESRITRMELCPPNPNDFAEIQELIRTSVSDPAYCSRIQARAILMAGKIRESARVLSSAVAKYSGDSRTGQQYGAIAAGYWSLVSDHPPTQCDADAWASSQDWTHIREAASAGDDASRCLEILLQAKILMDDDGGRRTLNVGELLKSWFETLPSVPAHGAASRILMRHGVHPIGDHFDVADNHEELKRIFARTHYAAGWKDHLVRLDGASGKVYQPPGGKTTRCVRIPRAVVEGLATEYEQAEAPNQSEPEEVQEEFQT